MERGNAYTIFFALIICLISSSALTLVSKGLEAKRNFNIEIDRKKNVLKAFGVAIKGKKTNEIVNYYDKNVNEYVVNKNGDIIKDKKPSQIDPTKDIDLRPVFKGASSEINGYAVPVEGPGLWGPVKGYFALENDMNSVKGISFYSHKETPGLGGEIEAQWFTKNFIGKKIFDDKGDLRSVSIVKGAVKDAIPNASEHIYYVDGISGATMTSNMVTIFIKSSLQNFEPHFNKIRKGIK